METRSAGKRWTWTEFARLPSEGGRRHEVLGGDLVVTPAPGRTHRRVVTDLVTVLNAFVRKHDAGEVFAGPFDVLLSEGDFLEPDLVFVRRGRTELSSAGGSVRPYPPPSSRNVAISPSGFLRVAAAGTRTSSAG